MSSYLSVVYPDRVELLTDGACLAPDGTLADIREKVWRSPHIPLAVTGRGDMSLLKGFAKAILVMAECGSFDRTIEGLVNAVSRSYPAQNLAEILVAGISEKFGPIQYLLVTQDSSGLDRFKLYSSGLAYGGPPLDLDSLPSVENGLDEYATEIMERVRSTPAADLAGIISGEVYGTGGHIDHTVISTAGAMTRKLRTWPDEIGKPINPQRDIRAKSTKGWLALMN